MAVVVVLRGLTRRSGSGGRGEAKGAPDADGGDRKRAVAVETRRALVLLGLLVLAGAGAGLVSAHRPRTAASITEAVPRPGSDVVLAGTRRRSLQEIGDPRDLSFEPSTAATDTGRAGRAPGRAETAVVTIRLRLSASACERLADGVGGSCRGEAARLKGTEGALLSFSSPPRVEIGLPGSQTLRLASPQGADQPVRWGLKLAPGITRLTAYCASGTVTIEAVTVPCPATNAAEPPRYGGTFLFDTRRAPVVGLENYNKLTVAAQGDEARVQAAKGSLVTDEDRVTPILVSSGTKAVVSADGPPVDLSLNATRRASTVSVSSERVETASLGHRDYRPTAFARHEASWSLGFSTLFALLVALCARLYRLRWDKMHR